MIRRLSIIVLGAFALATVSVAAERPDILGKLRVPAQTLPVFGQRIVYYEAGHGKTLVLLCNLGWDSNAWSQNLPALARDYHVIALDLVGTGQSSKPLIE